MFASATTTEIPALVSGSTPGLVFTLKWPTGVTYVAGDTWTLTAVVPPVWDPM